MSLTPHDINILHKIADPEYNPSPSLQISHSAPKDPHYPSPETYTHITSLERTILSTLQSAELSLLHQTQTQNEDSNNTLLKIYKEAVNQLSALITEYPSYASARNNRAQALRRIYGDLILVKYPNCKTTSEPTQPLATTPEHELLSTSTLILSDLSNAISLLSPSSSALSPTSAKTLSLAYTQRGALYHLTSKELSKNAGTELRIEKDRREYKWSILEWEEAASGDFMRGGQLGNEVAKGLAVAANPMAKLCGGVVREALLRERVGEGRGSVC